MAVASDLEGTLTNGRTWKALGRYLSEHGHAFRYRQFFGGRLPRALLTRVGVRDRNEFQSDWLQGLLTLFEGMTRTEFDAVAHWVVEHELWPRRREDVIASLRVHQAAGERLVLVSATFQPILEAFAERLGNGGFIEAIGTAVEWNGGRLTGRVQGPMNVGDTKALRLHDMLERERLYAAYGDTETDIPMLMLGDKPVAVYPDERLRRTARELGWTILEP